MAPLTSDAQAARVEATRLRSEAQGAPKLAVRGNLARSRKKLGRAQVEAGRARTRCVAPLPSPWSELHWTQSYETLEQTLVPLPSAR